MSKIGSDAHYMQRYGLHAIGESTTQYQGIPITFDDVMDGMVSVHESLTNSPGGPVYIMGPLLTHQRKVRRWRGKVFVFRGWHDALKRVEL